MENTAQDNQPLKIPIRSVNSHIVCSLCAGYFIDATTITECLHTFCRSCIVKYLQSSKHCPQCNLVIPEAQPLCNLRSDRTMQDIIYKLVPGLFEDEERRREEFYRSRGIGNQKQTEAISSAPCLSVVNNNPEGHLHRYDEQVCLCLERYSPQQVWHYGESFALQNLDKKFLRCSVRVLVSHLKEMLSKKLTLPRAFQCDLLCNGSVLDDLMSTRQVWLMFWRRSESPMILFYRIQDPDHGVT